MVERRYRVGVLVPQGSAVHEAEFGRMPHDQVEFRFASFVLPAPCTAAFCARLVAAVSVPMNALRQWGVDLVLLGCTTASISCEDTPWRSVLADLAGVPLVTAAGASRAALATLGLRRLAVVTPYRAASNAIVRRFLECSSTEFVRIDGIDFEAPPERWSAVVGAITPDAILHRSLRLDGPDVDGLYLPCTGMVSVAVVKTFERRTGKTATSSVQAAYWSVLNALGLESRRADEGLLLRRNPSELGA